MRSFELGDYSRAEDERSADIVLYAMWLAPGIPDWTRQKNECINSMHAELPASDQLTSVIVARSRSEVGHKCELNIKHTL